MDKIGIIITARMTSKRFPNKIFAKFRGRRVIDFVYDTALAFDYPIVFAIPKQSSNDDLELYCSIHRIDFYRGLEEDVLARVLEAAKKFKFDTIILLGADSPDTRPEDIVENLEKFKREKGKRMIWGMNSFVFSTKILEEVEKNSIHAVDREHCGFHYMTKTIDYPDDIDRLE